MDSTMTIQDSATGNVTTDKWLTGYPGLRPGMNYDEVCFLAADETSVEDMNSETDAFKAARERIIDAAIRFSSNPAATAKRLR